MKVKPSYLFLTLALASATTSANTFERPDVYGDILGQVRWEDGQDYQSEIHRATVGLKGKHTTEHVNVIYTLEGEYSEDLTQNVLEDQDFDTRISEANLVLVNRKLGSIFFGNSTTGTYKNLYSKVDIFESNNMHVSSNASLFRQAKSGTNQLAYATPIWNNLQFKGAVISPNNSNEEDVDIFGLRLLYNTESFSLVLNRAEVSDKQLPPNNSDDYVRWALASSYTIDSVKLGALIELNNDDVVQQGGDSTVYAVSGQYAFDNVTLKLGVQHKAYDTETSSYQDHSLYLASASYAFSNQFSAYVEVAEYSEDFDGENHNDNVNIGLNVKF